MQHPDRKPVPIPTENGLNAVRIGREFRPDAAVLDIMLPDIDGLWVMRRLRADQNDVPVLFLTTKDAVADRVAGITAGGDDYVTNRCSRAGPRPARAGSCAATVTAVVHGNRRPCDGVC
jgi:PleD family two-component response regulator